MPQLFLLIALFCLGCTGQGQNGILPENYPPDLTLRYHYDGGMQYYSEDLLLTKDSCVFNKNDNGKKTTLKFVLSKTEWEAFYAMLKKNHFDKIEYRTESNVYDRGGIRMDLSWNKDQRTLKIDDSQVSFVEKRWDKDWNAICQYISELTKSKK